MVSDPREELWVHSKVSTCQIRKEPDPQPHRVSHSLQFQPQINHGRATRSSHLRLTWWRCRLLTFERRLRLCLT
ncbi:unnamed protein product [Penicillium camemberti]|uniref:Str. FM013 n=1 Tax=Penicillium camemberti (strain FM 013) TaxID=1429867 RepID=A0A0G4NVK9_PENC3|nr:unnamed protein product [Penicillium camemberti]